MPVFGRLGPLERSFGSLAAGTAGASGPAINLDNYTFPQNSAIGTVVGNLSVLRGSGTYTYTLTSNPGSLFQISGSQLQVANASIAAGSYPITIHADNGVGGVVNRTVTLIATGSVGGYAPTYFFLGF
jgi:hypothetical protein